MPLGPPPDSIDENDEFFKLEDSEEAKIKKKEHLLPTQLSFMQLQPRRSVRTTVERHNYRQLTGFRPRKQNN